MSAFEQLMERARQAYAAGRATDAIAALDEASALAKAADQFRLIAGTHRRFGRLHHAASALREVLRHDPRAVDAWLHLSLLEDAGGLADADLVAMQRLHGGLDGAGRIPLGFALANAYAARDDHEQAARYYAEANAARRAGLDFSIEAAANEIAALMAAFTPDFFARFAGAGNADVSPIFIVGMPRSGSTLTEQILASHRDVLGGGEMTLLPRVEKTMLQTTGRASLGDALDRIGPAALLDWAAAYLEPVRAALGGKRRFTDKTLDNFLRIGLIRVLFPRARVVHCRRDPLDTCFSIWRRLFGSDTVPYGYELSELGSYYRLHELLMAHWARVLPGFVFAHSYERLVDASEPSIRALLEFCGLDWDPACLAFHRTERGVATASAVQVRRPLYDASIGAAEPYRQYLRPLINTLTAPLQPGDSGAMEQP